MIHGSASEGLAGNKEKTHSEDDTVDGMEQAEHRRRLRFGLHCQHDAHPKDHPDDGQHGRKAECPEQCSRERVDTKPGGCGRFGQSVGGGPGPMSSGTGSETPRDWSTLMGNGCEPEAGATDAVAGPSISVLLQTVFRLRSQDLATYNALGDHPGASTKELAAAVDRDRSNVNRSLTRLTEARLVCRQRRLLDQGGYFYAYFVESGGAVKTRLTDALGRWADTAEATIESHQWDDERSQSV